MMYSSLHWIRSIRGPASEASDGFPQHLGVKPQPHCRVGLHIPEA